jgi:hypothetical protein
MEVFMIDPPVPPPTNTDDHPPGISYTLQENAAQARDVQEEGRKAREREAEDTEQREREAIRKRLDL